MAGWQRRPPVGSGGRQLEHRLVAWRLAQQRAPVLVRILAGEMRELVDEALDDEPVLRRAHRAPDPKQEAKDLVGTCDAVAADRNMAYDAPNLRLECTTTHTG